MKTILGVLLMVVVGGLFGVRATLLPYEPELENATVTLGYFIGVGVAFTLVAILITIIPAAISRIRLGAWPSWFMPVAFVVLVFELLAFNAIHRNQQSEMLGSLDVSRVPGTTTPAGELRSEFQEFSQEALAGLAPSEPQPHSDRELAELITQIYQRLFADVVSGRQSYFAELQEIGWEELLEPGRLQRDRRSGFAESKIMLEQAKSTALRHWELAEDIIDSYSEELIQVMRTEHERRMASEGLQQGLQTFERGWQLELSALEKIEQIVELFATDPDWSYENGQFWFVKNGYAEKFNALMSDLDRIVEMQERDLSIAAGDVDQILDRLDRELQR